MDGSERAHSSLGVSPSPVQSALVAPGAGASSFSATGAAGNRGRPAGIPPASPYSRIQIPGSSGRLAPGQGHSRSLSQPPAFFSYESLPPFVPSPPAVTTPPVAEFGKCSSFRAPGGAGVEGESMPLRKAHRRSLSEVPSFFSGGAQSSDRVKRELEWDVGGESVDELFSVYMNLEAMASDDSRASGSRTNGAESSEDADSGGMESSVGDTVDPSPEKKAPAKRSLDGGIRHGRSLSVDSFMGKLPSFGDEAGNSNAFNIDLVTNDFTAAEIKKIMANEKLVEMAASDPKRVKRILANRQSAARSKERKMRYISELEHKVQTLQTEATTLSTQLTMMQRDSSGLTNQNNELKLRLQAMEQQAHLRDALNEALTAEVQHLKLATQDLRGPNFNNISPLRMQINPQMFQFHEQSPQLSLYQLQHQQTNESAATQESN